MKQRLDIAENGLHLVLDVTETGEVRLLHFSALPLAPADLGPESQQAGYRLVEVQISGMNPHAHHGSKHLGTCPGNLLRYTAHKDYRTPIGRKLEVTQAHDGLSVTSHLQFYDQIPTVRAWTELVNHGKHALGVEFVSSFCLSGISKEGLHPWDQRCRLHIPHNSWLGEAQWRSNSLFELGLTLPAPIKRLWYGSTGTWSTSTYLPMGCLENTEAHTTHVWQIEHHGSWFWELSANGKDAYLLLSGPTENESLWWKNLKPGESFTTVPAAVGCVSGGFEAAMGALTAYRRQMRRPHADNEKLPIIFNDYMNCLWGDPTTEKLLPLIDAAAAAGCEYFCIDAGWYADGGWWDGVGEWHPSAKRFPNGIKEPLDHVRAKGMIPGLWLELEVMGINCDLATRAPDAWFFLRHGKRVIDHSRYQLDYRHPDVIRHADAVIDRLVIDYGVGYIKMDYNINAGPGTELGADSFGDGLLGHQRAYLDWLDRVFDRYPALVIENCSSGGQRMDYGLLSRHSILSSSDQTDYRKYAVIAASCPTGVTPEQCAVWSYPLKDGDREEVIFNMVNAMLMRIHQSGHLAQISPERFALVKEGLDTYKRLRHLIPQGRPFWPLGLPDFHSDWTALGLDCGGKSFLAVWRLQSTTSTCLLRLPHLAGEAVQPVCLYPAENQARFAWNPVASALSVELPQNYMARLFEF